MLCDRIDTLLPSFVGDDLDDASARAVAAHVTSCRRCTEEVRLYRASLALVADAEPEFDEAFFASVRSGVLAEIDRVPSLDRRRTGRAGWTVYALAASVAALAVSALVFLVWANDRPQAERASMPSAFQMDDPNPATEKGPGRQEEVAGLGPSDPEAVVPSKPRSRKAALPQHSKHPTPRIPQVMISTEDMMRIDYQTADPTIRIIWFVPKPEPGRGLDTKGA